MDYKVYESCDSTNRIAKELAKEGAPHGTCVVAYEQTAGRGRMGRSFYSPSGRGLYLSLVLRPGKDFDPSNQLLTIYAGYAVAKALDIFTLPLYGLETKVKWVNDILLHGRKIAGILAENVDQSNEKGGAVILGVGINLFGKEADFPEELEKSAGTLFGETIEPESWPETREKVLNEVVKEILKWDGNEYPEDMIEEYQRRSYLLGRSIDFTLEGQQLYGVVTSVMQNGNLMVVLPEGSHVSLSSGEISLHKKNL